jgi:quercetin dioxygenase-like cupin family protein
MMTNDIANYVSRTNVIPWMPLQEDGTDTTGIAVKVLRFNEQTKRAPTIMLKFDPGARYPYHNHPAGEEILVLEGSVVIEGETLVAGDYLYTPPGFRHAVTTQTGCILLLMIPEEVQILV